MNNIFNDLTNQYLFKIENELNSRSKLSNNGIFTLVSSEEHKKNIQVRNDARRNVQEILELDFDFFDEEKDYWCPVFRDYFIKFIIEKIDTFEDDDLLFDDKKIEKLLYVTFRCFNYVPRDIREYILKYVIETKQKKYNTLISHLQLIQLIKNSFEKLQFGKIKNDYTSCTIRKPIIKYSYNEKHNCSNFGDCLKKYNQTLDEIYLYDLYQILINMVIDNTPVYVLRFNNNLGCIDLPNGKYISVFNDKNHIPGIYYKFVTEISFRNIVEMFYNLNSKGICKGIIFNYSPLEAKGLELDKQLIDNIH